MTKKDYISIAKALRAARGYSIDSSIGPREAAHMQWNAVVEEIARVLYADNTRFDEDRFRAATQGEQ